VAILSRIVVKFKMQEPMKSTILFSLACSLLLLLPVGMIHAQDGCEVLIPELQGFYQGKCKKGLAHGKGRAEGIDSYEGHFSKGQPNGSGKYTWANGEIYVGEWAQGKAHGKGTMTYQGESGDTAVSGIWRKGEYMGKEVPPPYQITRKRGVVRYSIHKLNNTTNGIRLTLLLAGNFNVDVEDFSMVSDSGEEYQSGRYYALQNAIVPYAVSIKYRTWNSLHSAKSEVVFDFVINEPGMFEVSITN
jgi:hypothetical protein